MRLLNICYTFGSEKDEVLFKHIAGSDDDRREGESRKGYAKILAACKQAIKDKWGYIWIDTCCIDKQSSAELSEAINSMYAWYWRSEVCYGYLEDVESGAKARNTTFETVPFEKSRWFSRGWTLQELIAPRRVVFYSRDWTDIGTKASLRDVISAVTDIRVEMITNYDPDRASVAEKMSWAAKRRTTRDEDIAYCLMGLLGVNMPLLYGEGTRAFRRLQEEIMRLSDDHSIFAWRADYHYHDDHSELMRKTQGMLADSPLNFLGAGDVVRSDVEGPYLAYSMSNKGLQIGLPIRRINPKEPISVDPTESQDIFKAILDCTYRDTSPTRWVVIYLKMVGKGRYVRIFPYWLDEIQINPNEADTDGWAITSLLVPQVDTSTTNSICSKHLKLKILPTVSGYTHKGEDLVKGGSYTRHNLNLRGPRAANIFIFDREGKHFGVVIGQDKGIPWMDIIKEDDYEHELSLTSGHDITNKIQSLYEEGGPRCHVVLRHLDMLCMNVSKDYSVDISREPKPSASLNLFVYPYVVTIDIRRTTIQVPLLVHTTGNFLDDLDPHDVHSNSKKEGADWFAIFNTKVKRVLDVSPTHSLSDEGSVEPIVLFSPDGKHLATATNNTVQIYDTTSGSITYVLSDKSIWELYVLCMCFSPNGNFLAIGPYDGHVLLWDVTKKCLHRDFTSQQYGVKVLKFSPDNRLIISIREHGMVQISDIINGTSEDFFDLGYKGMPTAAISPNNQLVAGAHGAVIRIWDLETKQLIRVLQEHNQDVNCIKFTPDGKGLLSGSDDQTLKCWYIDGLTAAGVKQSERSNNIGSVNNPRIPCVPVDKDVDRSSQCVMDIRHKYAVSDIAVSHDGNWIVSLSAEGNIQFWGARDSIVQFILRRRTGINSIRSLNTSPAGNIFATYTGQNRVQIWKYENIVAIEQ